MGYLFILAGFLILFFTFAPVLKEELNYQTNQLSGIKYSLDIDPDFLGRNLKPIVPVDKEFSIVVPKIGVNAKIYPDMDPKNP